MRVALIVSRCKIQYNEFFSSLTQAMCAKTHCCNVSKHTDPVSYTYFSATMEVKEDFFMYKGGVYRSSLPANFLPPNHRKTGFHSVKILG